jgi:hypothetical protein
MEDPNDPKDELENEEESAELDPADLETIAGGMHPNFSV